ncbi:hypothetical protein N752_05985 [Desulforamulus aquiferis]|nr:hypothetical protein N752_05985 [Desulforamulus aquiferis]
MHGADPAAGYGICIPSQQPHTEKRLVLSSVHGNYLNLDANGNAELRDKTNTPEGNTKWLLRNLGGYAYALETVDGKRLGISSISNGARVKVLANDPNNPLLSWRLCGENKPSKDICSLRPIDNQDMILNASGQKKADGTAIILWTHIDKWVCPVEPVPDGPEHSEFRFIPADNPDAGTAKAPATGWYCLEVFSGNNQRTLNIDASGNAELNRWNSSTEGTREFYVENKGNNQITARMKDGRYLGIADPITDGTRVKAVSSPYLWNAYKENTAGLKSSYERCSLRPPAATTMAINASNKKSDIGTPVILWTEKNMDAPSHAEWTFTVLREDQIPNVQLSTKPTPAPVTPPTITVTATPSKTSFVMNSKPVSVTAAYTINSTNYLQLRAIAAMLNGTAAQFDVGWDGQYVVIEPGKSYSGAVTETKLQNTMNVRQSGTKFKMNGEVFTFADARLIDGDTNYLQLREFAQKLSGTASQFNMYWDSAAGQAVIKPGVAYTGSAS